MQHERITFFYTDSRSLLERTLLTICLAFDFAAAGGTAKNSLPDQELVILFGPA